MRQKILTQGRYAVVTSTLALFLALGGTAYAVNTVDSLDIVNDSITSVDVKNNALSTVDVSDGTLTGADVQDNTVQSVDIQTGTILGQDLAPLVAVPSIWAAVDASGDLINGHRVSNTDRDGTGLYGLNFNTNPDGCAWLATATNRSGPTPVAGAVVSMAFPDNGDGDLAVSTTVDGVRQDMAFNVALIC